MAEEAPQSFSSLISEFIINFTASKGQIDNQFHQLHHHLELTVDSRLDFPRFDGSSDGSAGIEWIIRANHFFDYFKTVDDNRLTIAYYHMDGRALEWIQKGQPYQSWNEFSKDFVYWMRPSNWDEQRGIEFIESLSSGYDRSLHVRENVHSIFFHPKLEIEEPKLQNNNDLPIKSSELPSNCENASKTLSHYPLNLYMEINTYAKVMEKLMLGGQPPTIRCNAEMTTMKYIGYVRMGNWNPYGSSKIVEVKLSTLGFGRVYLHRYLYEICCMGKEEKLAAVCIRICKLPLLHGRPQPLPDDALQQQDVPFFKPAISNLDPHAQWKVLLQETEFSLNGSVGEEVLGIDLEHDKQVSTLLDPKLEVGGLSTTEPLTNLEWTHSDIESNSNKKTTNVGERKDYIFDPGGSLACIARPLKSIFLSIHHFDIEDSIYEFDDKVVQDQMNAHHIIVAHSMYLASTSTLLQSTAFATLT